MLQTLLLLHIVLSIPITRTSGIMFNAAVLCLFWLTKHAADSAQLSAPEVVTAAYGGSVTVSCQYDHRFREYTKYWCKGPIYELCTTVVNTNRNGDRSSIADDKDAGAFTVTMTSLRESDEGKYWCVIARLGRNVYTGVSLVVSHTVITTTASSQMTHDGKSWWATLRWILFILMLCCFVSTHVVMWSIKTNQQLPHKNSNIYE